MHPEPAYTDKELTYATIALINNVWLKFTEKEWEGSLEVRDELIIKTDSYNFRIFIKNIVYIQIKNK